LTYRVLCGRPRREREGHSLMVKSKKKKQYSITPYWSTEPRKALRKSHCDEKNPPARLKALSKEQRYDRCGFLRGGGGGKTTAVGSK